MCNFYNNGGRGKSKINTRLQAKPKQPGILKNITTGKRVIFTEKDNTQNQIYGKVEEIDRSKADKIASITILITDNAKPKKTKRLKRRLKRKLKLTYDPDQKHWQKISGPGNFTLKAA